MTHKPQPDRQNGDGLEYALGALRTIAASAHDTSAKQMAAIAQAGIDLATQGPIESGSERGDGPARDAAEGAEPVVRDTNMFSRLADEPPAIIPEGYSAHLDIRTAAEIEHDRLAAKAAPTKPTPDVMREALKQIAAFNITPSTAASVAMMMRRLAQEADALPLPRHRIVSAVPVAPVPPADGKCPDCGKNLDDDDEPHQIDCENRPAGAGAAEPVALASLYTIFKKYLPADAERDSFWQEVTEWLQPGASERDPTPDMRIAGGIAWAEASKTAETYVDCADACWKAMWDVR